MLLTRFLKSSIINTLFNLIFKSFGNFLPYFIRINNKRKFKKEGDKKRKIKEAIDKYTNLLKNKYCLNNKHKVKWRYQMEVKVFAKKEYFRAMRLYPGVGKISNLAEEGEKYHLGTEDEYEVHKEHDKLFKKILERLSEAEFAIKKVLNLDKNEKLEIISVRNEFVTIDFRGKQADMVYKLKDKDIYFIIEHQSTQDPDMAFRILEYEVEIMDRAFKENGFRSKFCAKVIPIVIYTGKGRWRQPKSVVEIQEEFGYKTKPDTNYAGIGEYNVLDINECTKEELLEEGTFLSKAMLMEKARSEDELIAVLDKIIPMTKEDEKADMIEILRYILVKDLGKEKAKKYIKMLEGGMNMGTFVNELRADRERTILSAKKEGKEEGREEGREEGIFQVALEMLKFNMKDEDILKVTHISKKDLKALKLQMA